MYIDSGFFASMPWSFFKAIYKWSNSVIGYSILFIVKKNVYRLLDVYRLSFIWPLCHYYQYTTPKLLILFLIYVRNNNETSYVQPKLWATTVLLKITLVNTSDGESPLLVISVIFGSMLYFWTHSKAYFQSHSHALLKTVWCFLSSKYAHNNRFVELWRFIYISNCVTYFVSIYFSFGFNYHVTYFILSDLF